MNEMVKNILEQNANKVAEMIEHYRQSRIAQEQYRQLTRNAREEDTCDYDEQITDAASLRNEHDIEYERIGVELTTKMNNVQIGEFWNYIQSVR